MTYFLFNILFNDICGTVCRYITALAYYCFHNKEYTRQKYYHIQSKAHKLGVAENDTGKYEQHYKHYCFYDRLAGYKKYLTSQGASLS